MSTRYNNGSHCENHQRAAELHDLAAHEHRSAAEDHDKQDHMTGRESSRYSLEHSQKAYLGTQEAHRQGHVNFGHDEIAILAHEFWRARGCPEGSPEQDWFDASQKLRARTREGEKSKGAVRT